MEKKTDEATMLDRQNERKTILYWILAGVIILGFFIAQRLPLNEEGVIFGMNYNLFSYAVIVGGTYLLFFAAIVILEKKCNLSSSREIGERRFVSVERLFCLILFALAAFFLYRIYCYEVEMLGFIPNTLRHLLPKRGYALFILSLFGVFVLFDGKEAEPGNKWARAAVCLVGAAMCALCCYASNPYLDEGGTLYHTHAYTNTIVLVTQGKPFDAYNVSVYGHYALLYWPLVKLLGNNYQAIARAITLVAFVAYGVALWVCSRRIRKTSAFLLAVAAICAVPMMLYCSGQYYQVSPHRLLFPALAILFVSWKSEKKIASVRNLYLWEILLGTLAIIWNTETGLFSLAVLVAFNFMALWQGEKEAVSFGKAVRRIAGSIGIAVGSIILAYAVVNAYTLLTGGSLMFLSRFIYPLMNHGYIEYMRWQLPPVFSLYIVQIVLFSVGVFQGGFALYEKAKGLKQNIGKEILLCCVSVSGLASLTYFMNRTAYANISASWIQMAIVMGLLADGAIHEIKAHWATKKPLLPAAGKGICLLFLFVFAIETVLSFENAVKTRVETDWRKSDMRVAAEWVRVSLPENTTGMGTGVPELFYETHKDPGCVLIDWSDMLIDPEQINLQRAREIVAEHREYLFLEDEAAAMLDLTGYKSVNSLEIGKFRYDLYQFTEK